MNKVHIITLGCKLNQFESKAIADNLSAHGFEITTELNNASHVVVHSCTVTNKADAKSRQMMRKAKRLGKTVIAAGCLATTDKHELKEQSFIDLVVDNSEKYRLGEILLERNEYAQYTLFPAVRNFERTRGMIKIQEGCDKFCSYCKIPYARGKSVSADPSLLFGQARQLISNDYKELVLTGVNISDYQYQGWDLGKLTEHLLDMEGNFRIRWSSLQPDEFQPEWIELLKHPKFAAHFHLSLQSGSDTVLERMNRHYTGKHFRSLIERIRNIQPDCGITTDIIVGFPGESDREFEETLSLVDAVEFSRVHVFPYSPRANTPAANMKDLNGTIKRDRERKLRKAAISAAERFTRREVIGKSQTVLIETGAEGYTSNYYRFHTKRKEFAVNRFADFVPEKMRISIDGVIELEDA